MTDATGTFKWLVGNGGACFVRALPTAGGRRILTVDPGLRVGWAVVSLPEKKIEGAGFAELDRNKLYASAHKLMSDLITRFDCDEILFEKYFLSAFIMHTKKGGTRAMVNNVVPASLEMRGAIKAVAECNGMRWSEISPSTARANLNVGRLNSDAHIRDVVCDLFNVPKKYRPDENKKKEIFMEADAFDALVLAWSADTI